MTLEHLFLFNLALLAAIVSPGPALITAIHTTLNNDRLAGLSVGIGLGLVAAAWTLMALLGLEIVFQLWPWAYTAVKSAGALYLLYIAWKTWTNAGSPIQSKTRTARHAMLHGVFINLLNPKSVLFAAAVLVVIFPPGMSAWENTLVVVNHLLFEWIFYSAVAVVMSSPVISHRYLQAKRTLDQATALIIGVLGLRLLFDKR